MENHSSLLVVPVTRSLTANTPKSEYLFVYIKLMTHALHAAVTAIVTPGIHWPELVTGFRDPCELHAKHKQINEKNIRRPKKKNLVMSSMLAGWIGFRERTIQSWNVPRGKALNIMSIHRAIDAAAVNIRAAARLRMSMAPRNPGRELWHRHESTHEFLYCQNAKHAIPSRYPPRMTGRNWRFSISTLLTKKYGSSRKSPPSSSLPVAVLVAGVVVFSSEVDIFFLRCIFLLTVADGGGLIFFVCRVGLYTNTPKVLV